MNCMQFAAAAALLALTACASESESLPDAGPDAAAPDAPTHDAGLPTVFGGARPADLLVPSSYDPSQPTPLVVALHGYHQINSYVTGVIGFNDLYESAGFLLIAPHGTQDADGKYFWNATDACCNFYANPVDDVAYINGLVDEISAAYNVDPKRIYLVGHSNGGFMSYRLACESSARFAAIISIAGASFDDASKCAPTDKINILQIHGTADSTIKYDGGSIKDHAYPSAAGSVARWAAYNGCATTTTPGFAMDVTNDSGAETDPLAYDGCPTGGSVAFWTVNDGEHLLFMATGQPLWDWLVAHPKP
jgi:polyhydroxybutyrate depolymerase